LNDEPIEATSDGHLDEKNGAPRQVEHIHLPRRRHFSPWGSRRLLLASVVIALLALPLWLDPFTLRELRSETPRPTTVAEATPRPTRPRPRNTPQPQVTSKEFARDAFQRVNDNGWGRGYSTVVNSFANLDVNGTAGVVQLGREGSGWAYTGDPHRDVEVSATVGFSRIGGTVSAGPALRVTDDGLYRARLVSSATGTYLVIEHVSAVVDEAATVVGGPVALRDITLEAGEAYVIKALAAGSDPVTISAKAWPANESEPEDWQVQAVDWTGSLQHEGQIGVSWQAQSVPEGGVNIFFDALVATTTDTVAAR
jgi:hypothetical protein